MSLETKTAAAIARGSKPSPRVFDVLSFFSDLNDAEKAELLSVASYKHAQRGQQLFLAGDPITHLYWICTGTVQLYRETPDGHELTDSFQVIGDVLFDPDALQNKSNHVMNAKALQNTTLLAVPMDWITSHLKSWDHLANKFLYLLAARAQEARLEAEHQATMNAAQIITCFLQHMCVAYGFDPCGFTLPYTKSLIASRLGMELESFSRTLPKLRELGIVVKGKEVSFTDIASAQAFCCGRCSAAEQCPTHRVMKGRSNITKNRSRC